MRVSADSETARPVPKMIAIAANSATPWRGRPSIRPNRKGIANAISSCDQSSSVFVNGVPLSNGCAELALKKPPPLVPKCLIAIWLAAGPRAIT